MENINQVIHEKVMGAKWYHFVSSANNTHRFLSNTEHHQKLFKLGKIVLANMTEPIFEDNDEQIPNYCDCESITDAWKVVEKMEADGWDFEMHGWEAQGIRTYDVEFAKHTKDGLETGESQAESLPMAICKAALKAIGGDEVDSCVV